MSTTRINDSDLASVALYDKVNAIANEFDAEVVKLTGDQTIEDVKTFTDEIFAPNQLDYSRITNCLTKIPQDIKLELVDGTLTLKAGSKVYVPNGANKFDEVVISADITKTWTGSSSDTVGMLFVNANNPKEIKAYFITSCVSGTTAPTLSSTYGYWYDTTNNLIKLTSDKGSSWSGKYSLPICIITANTTQITSIDQVFNGFGYIGSTVFVLPGVKGLIPDGRNEDGSLKNEEFTTSKVLTHTRTAPLYGAAKIILKQNQVQLGDYITQYNYNKQENKFYYTPFMDSSWCDAGTYLINGTTVISFTPKTPFHAVDYDDLNRVDEEVATLDAQNVKLTGNQTINDTKTFNAVIKAKSGFDVINTNAVKGTNPTSTVYWGLFRANDGSGASAWRDTRLGIGEVSLQANGNTALLLGVYKNEAGSSSNSAIQIVHEIGGNKYATCPTPAISDNSTKIATTNWFNQKIQVVSTLPASPNSNVYYFVTG